MRPSFIKTIILAISVLQFAFHAISQSPCDSLIKRTETALYAGDVATAYKVAQEAILQCSLEYDSNHVQNAIAWNYLAGAQYYREEFAEAEANFLKAIRIAEITKDSADSPYGDFLINLANVYSDGDHPEKAVSLYEKGLFYEKNKHGNTTLNYGNGLSGLGNAWMHLSEFEKADSLYVEARKILEKTDTSGFSLLAVLHNQANCYEALGELEKALNQFNAVIEKQKQMDSLGFSLLYFYNSLAIVQRDLKQYEQAEQTYQTALKFIEERGGANSERFMLIINGLANNSFDLNDAARADSLLQILGSWLEKRPGKSLELRAVYFNGLGRYYRIINELEKAIEGYHASLEWEEKIAPGRKTHRKSTTLFNLAGSLTAAGKYEEATATFQQSMSIVEDVYGKQSEDYARQATDRGWLCELTNQMDSALAWYGEANDIFLSLIDHHFDILSESGKEAYIEAFHRNSNLLWSFTLKTNGQLPDSWQLAMDNPLRLKGIVLTSSQEVLNSIQEYGDPQLLAKYQHWLHVRKQYSRQVSLPKSSRKYDADSLLQAASNLETSLTLESRAFRKARQVVDWKEVQIALPQDEVAVEFIHFQYKSKQWTDSIFYAALLLRPGWKHPKMVYLCEEKQLAALFQQTGDEATTIRETYQTHASAYRKGEKASRLYDLLWKPLEKELRGVKKIYYSPSGLLHQVAFPAISERPGKLLADRYELEYVGSTRELVTGRDALPGDAAHVRSAAIFGGIRYETDTTLLAIAERKIECESCPRGGERSYPNFLPGSLSEMRALDSLFAKRNIACDTFSGYEALEARVKELSSDTARRSPDVLHLSTHGYFYPDPKAAADKAAYDAPFKWADNPLFRSYLLMAGGLAAHQGKLTLGSYDDGILSAYEIAPLNLSNTKLVVLSACQTGLGDVRGSEGVYGLQRAFKMAGVERLLVTLWQVDDRATAAFMKSFYGHWLSGMDIRAAFRKAQADIRATAGWEDPYFWAGFVLM